MDPWGYIKFYRVLRDSQSIPPHCGLRTQALTPKPEAPKT